MGDEKYTPEQMLTEVNNAIYAVLVGGQSYKIGTRELTRADLGLLKSMRSELEAQVAAQSSAEFMENTYVAIFSGR